MVQYNAVETAEKLTDICNRGLK